MASVIPLSPAEKLVEANVNNAPSRRNALRMAASSALIIGFNAGTRSWVTRAQAAQAPLQTLPKLDGLLQQDDASRQAIAIDRGNIFHRIPAAVLEPGSVQDVIMMVRYANEHAVKVVMKGQGHSRYGQTQAEAGIVINSATLNNVHTLTSDTVDAEPGASWGDVARVTLTRGLTPPVMPDTMTLTVGGTLSAGGMGNTSQHFGAQVDNVAELDVVTGDGRIVTCSPESESELFDMVLAGMGQCGIIVRAKLRLVSAPDNVRLHRLVYDDLDTFIADQMLLATDGRFDHQSGLAVRQNEGSWRFIIVVGMFHASLNEADFTALNHGLRFVTGSDPVSYTYWNYLQRFAASRAAFSLSGSADLPAPAIAMWIPAATTAEYVRNVLNMPPDLLGFHEFSFWPCNTIHFTRPLLSVPNGEIMFTLWLFRNAPRNDPASLSAVMESNRKLIEQMTAIGGKWYSPYTPITARAGWEGHFGPKNWQRLSAAKRRFLGPK
jgi:hypothetical protein